MRFLLNPAILYVTLWSGLLFLYELGLSKLLLPLSPAAGLFFLASTIAFLSGYLLFALATGELVIAPQVDSAVYRQWVLSKRTNRLLVILSIFLAAGLSVEIFYCKNLPLLFLLGIGRPVFYTDFGFPGIHGLLNAIFLVISTIIFVRQLLAPRAVNILLLLAALSWPILLVARQLFVSLIVQFALLSILIKGIPLKHFLKLLFLGLILVVVFGIIGDLRSGRHAFIALAQPNFAYPNYLPSGFLWVYIYMVSPVNNVINNIEMSPLYAPIGVLANLLPSFARDELIQLLDTSLPSWDLVEPILNVSSMHQKYIMDFGLFFTCIIYLTMSFVFSFLPRLSAREPRYGFALVVILHGILFSFFVDFILHLVFLAQSIIYIVIFRGCAHNE